MTSSAPASRARMRADSIGQALAFGAGLADDLAGGRVRLLDDERRLLLRTVAQLGGGALGGDERLAQQALELAMAQELILEVLDAVGEVHPFAPDLLEAVGDLEQQLFRRCSAVAADRSASERHMPDLDGSDRHLSPGFRAAR